LLSHGLVDTPAPSTLIASVSPSPSPFPISVPTEPILYNKVYLALVAQDLSVEPTANQYKALTRSLEEYFTATLQDLNEFDTELVEIVLTNEFNLFEEGIPDERFNILMNFDLSATFSDNAINIPDEEAIFSALLEFGITSELIIDVVRTLAPFQTVNEVVFRTSDLEAPP
jgi:hypothetical protein